MGTAHIATRLPPTYLVIHSNLLLKRHSPRLGFSFPTHPLLHHWLFTSSRPNLRPVEHSTSSRLLPRTPVDYQLRHYILDSTCDYAIIPKIYISPFDSCAIISEKTRTPPRRLARVCNHKSAAIAFISPLSLINELFMKDKRTLVVRKAGKRRLSWLFFGFRNCRNGEREVPVPKTS